MAKKGTGPQRGRLADMSLPPAERGRPRRETPRRRRQVPAQLDHATSPAARRKRRDGERAMDRERGSAGEALAEHLGQCGPERCQVP